IPPNAMKARTLMNLMPSCVNLKSTGLGNKMDLTSSPLAVEKPSSQATQPHTLHIVQTLHSTFINYLNIIILDNLSLIYFNFITLKELFTLLLSCFSTYLKSELPSPVAPFLMLRLQYGTLYLLTCVTRHLFI